MHQETERLVRETQVHIDPTEFTKRLQLSDFFTRFDSEKADAVSRKQRKQDALESKQKLRFSADSDDEVEIEIVGPKQQILAHGARSSRLFACAQKKKEEEKKDRDRLATILRYGSQPMHVSGALPAAKKADGPLALRSLNSALLEAVHKQDMGRKRKDKRHGEDSSQVIGDDEDEDMAMEDNGVEIDDEDVAMEEDSGSDADEPQPRTGSRKVVISDDEGDTVEESKPVGVSKPKPAEYPQSKAKFLGMFKMPAKKPAASPAAKPEEARVESSPTSDDPQVLPSQDLSYIFSGDHGLQTDTQDSLLLTPSAGTQQAAQQTTQPITQLTQQGTQPTQLLQQSMDPLGLLNSSLLAGDSQMSVGIPALGDGIPTQMTQSLQPTVPDREDSQSSDIPTLVRQALQLELSDDDGDDRPETAAEASSARAEKPGDQHPEIADESDGSQPRRRGRLLQRRAQLDEKKKKKMGRLERSEFLEDEAEEGESSDSDNDGQRTIRHRKFDWGNDSQANIPSDSENEFHELDTDEEAEQLLADPLINNEDMSDEEGNEAIRELHRQRAMEDDEKAIQELAKDIATGNLRNRGRARNLLGLDEEDYNDRQSRQERMEERARLRRKLMAKEIHDTNLAAIAKNPETAAFANAALMRPPTQSTRGSSSQAPAGDDDGDDDDEDDLLNDEMLDLEEEIDENSVAAAVQQQLSRPRMRIESDDDDNGSSDNDSSKQGSMGVRLADGSGFSTRMNSSQTSSNGLVGLADDGLDTPLSVESLIVRRKTLNSKSTLLPPGPGSLLKRPGASLLQSPMAKRYNAMKK
ncbi:hypothetical protein EC988_001861 [Linderina pennispora]|nr:hypothetical protein EC988_001861 [Linderina pennispora]